MHSICTPADLKSHASIHHTITCAWYRAKCVGMKEWVYSRNQPRKRFHHPLKYVILFSKERKQKTLPEDRLFVEPPLPFIISLSILSCFPSKTLISYDGSWNSRGYHVMWATDQNKTYLFSTCFMAYLVRNLGEVKLQSFLIY